MEALDRRASILVGEVQYHKRAIRQHRAALKAVSQELAELQAKCKEYGIQLISESGGIKRHG